MASLLRLSHMKLGTLPFRYLGDPIFYSVPKACHLKTIADAILDKFNSWQGKLLSMAGRVCLVNSVIESSFIHSFMVYKWPISLLKELEKIFETLFRRVLLRAKNL